MEWEPLAWSLEPDPLEPGPTAGGKNLDEMKSYTAREEDYIKIAISVNSSKLWDPRSNQLFLVDLFAKFSLFCGQLGKKCFPTR